MGLDLGDARIGVALSSPSGVTAYGHAVIARAGGEAIKPVMRELKEIARRHGVARIVLGMPYLLDGREGARARAARHFKEKLERHFKNMPVVLWDERLSTKAVGRALKNKAKVDEMAAAYILQGYLDSKRLEEKMGDGYVDSDNMIVLIRNDGQEAPAAILAGKETADGIYLLVAEEDGDKVAIVKCLPSAQPPEPPESGDDETLEYEVLYDTHEEFGRAMELFSAELLEFGIDLDE